MRSRRLADCADNEGPAPACRCAERKDPPMSFIDLNTLPVRELFPGFHGRMVHSPQMTLVHWTIDPGSIVIEHSHPHEQVVNVLEGRFEFTVGGETRILEAGHVVVVPGGVLHSGRAITACRVIDAFSP